MKHQQLEHLLLVVTLLHIVEDFAGVIVSQMTGRGLGGVGGNTACSTVGVIGEDGLTFVDSVQQCRFGGCAVGVDGVWLAQSAAVYPHKT